MGFVIDMISGEIQDNSSSTSTQLELNETLKPEMYDLYEPTPRIQEYVPLEETNRPGPETILNIDVDKFIDQM